MPGRGLGEGLKQASGDSICRKDRDSRKVTPTAGRSFFKRAPTSAAPSGSCPSPSVAAWTHSTPSREPPTTSLTTPKRSRFAARICSNFEANYGRQQLEVVAREFFRHSLTRSSATKSPRSISSTCSTVAKWISRRGGTPTGRNCANIACESPPVWDSVVSASGTATNPLPANPPSTAGWLYN